MEQNVSNPYASLSGEVLSLFETNARCWNDAAQRCEDAAAAVIDDREKPKWQLLAVVYRERANIHNLLLSKLRQRLDGSAR